MSFSNPLGAIGEIFHNRGLSNKQKVTGMLGAAARTFPVGAITLYTREWRRKYCALAPLTDYRLFYMVGVRNRPPMYGPPVLWLGEQAKPDESGMLIWNFEPESDRNNRSPLITENFCFAARENLTAAVRFNFGAPSDPVGLLFLNFRKEDNANLDDEVFMGQLHDLASYVGSLLRSLDEPTNKQIMELLEVNKRIASVSANITAMASEGDEGKVLESIAKGMMQLCGDSEAMVTIHSVKGNRVKVRCELPLGLVPESFRDMKRDSDKSIVAWVARTGRVVFIEDFKTVQQAWRDMYIPLREGVRSKVVIPLHRPGARSEKDVMGVINLETVSQGTVTQDMVYYWWIFAQQAAQTLTQTEKILKQRSEIMRIATTIADLAGKSVEGSVTAWGTSLLTKICKFACEETGGSVADIWIKRTEDGHPSMTGSYCSPWTSGECPRTKGFTSWLLEHDEASAFLVYCDQEGPEGEQRTVVDVERSKMLVRKQDASGFTYENWPSDEELKTRNQVTVDLKTKMELVVLLKCAGDTHAVLFVKFKKELELDRECIERFFLLADLAAIALGAQELAQKGLIAGFRHDVRRPLSRIQDFASTAEYNPDELKRITEKIILLTEYTSGMVDSYIPTTLGSTQYAHFEDKSEIHQLIEDAREILHEHAGKIKNNVPKQIWVRCERDILLPPLVNLLENAADATPPGKVSEVALTEIVTKNQDDTQDTDMVVITIKNPQIPGESRSAKELNAMQETGDGGVYFANALLQRRNGQVEYLDEGGSIVTRIHLPAADPPTDQE